MTEAADRNTRAEFKLLQLPVPQIPCNCSEKPNNTGNTLETVQYTKENR